MIHKKSEEGVECCTQPVNLKSTLSQIYATIHADNAPSIHVAQKLGMRLARHIVDEDGDPVDYYVIQRAGS